MSVDRITFEVVNNALVGVAEQMAATILRTSYSTVIREMLDYRPILPHSHPPQFHVTLVTHDPG